MLKGAFAELLNNEGRIAGVGTTHFPQDIDRNKIVHIKFVFIQY